MGIFTRVNIFFGINIIIIAIVLILSAVGVMMLYSAGGGWEPWAYKHVVKVLLCFAIMFIVARTQAFVWFKYAYYIYAISCLILLLMHLGIIGSDAGDINRWISFGWMSIQPSEFSKVAVILALAKLFHNAKEKPYYTVVPKYCMIVAVPVYLIFSQPDLGTAVLVILVSFAVLWCSSVPRIYYFIGILLLCISLPTVWTNLKDYQKERLFSFFDQSGNPDDDSYHAIQSRIAIGSGGWFGKGLMQGTQNRFGFLPVKESDFIFTIVCEEMGLLFATFLLLIYAAFIFIGLYLSVLYSDRVFSSLAIVGLSVNISLYVFVNIGMVTGMLPVVGVPLPLISYGGSSTLIMMITAGMFIAAHSQLGVKVR